MSRIPVFVLSGFLGSGKTTLLLRLLQKSQEQGLVSAVLMNELGNYDVDGAIISGDDFSANVEKLLGGCICCSKKSEVSQSIQQLLKRNPDVIFIELTGVANPEEIADCLTEPQLLGKLALQKIISIIDAEHVLEYNSIFASDKQLVRTLRRQIEVADLIVVNKIDLVNESHLSKVEKVLRKQNSQSPIVYTTKSKFELDPIFSPLQPIVRIKSGIARGIGTGTTVQKPEGSSRRQELHSMSFSRVQTISFAVPNPINTNALERFLKRWEPNLMRAKGYVSVENKEETYLMQYAGKRTNWETTKETDQHYLVLIGIDLDQGKMEEEWNKFLLLRSGY